ncbi:MAG: hypothetical protein GKS03_09130 [Alphaproteobacteria bacterium]|nr:hypothetical protein [Alphaproteobacteria bacterium]
MIPSKTAETVDKALDLLLEKDPHPEIIAAVERLKRIIATYAGDDDAFVPVDFTESDLSEGTRVFEGAGRKHINGYGEATRSATRTFRDGMNMAHTSKERTKCRTTLIVELLVAVVKKLS